MIESALRAGGRVTAPERSLSTAVRKGQRLNASSPMSSQPWAYPVTRDQQFWGGADSPDVVCERLREKELYLKVKVTKDSQVFSLPTLALRDALAKRDARVAGL